MDEGFFVFQWGLLTTLTEVVEEFKKVSLVLLLKCFLAFQSSMADEYLRAYP
jgi:hypothetical protein